MARTGGADEVDVYVGARISLRRSALGLSQSGLAQRIGVSFQQVQKYETGQNRISASRLHRVAEVLGTSVETFFPPQAELDGGDCAQALRSITATRAGRAVAAAFPMIGDPTVRHALARIVAALSRS
jgi:transcriptional regulator with XRE-family HTH domain